MSEPSGTLIETSSRAVNSPKRFVAPSTVIAIVYVTSFRFAKFIAKSVASAISASTSDAA